MKFVVLDASTLGDISYKPIEKFGEVTLYDRTKKAEVKERIRQEK